MRDAAFDPLQHLRELDPEVYAACLYLPESARNSIATIWAFDAEVSRIPQLVSEPMPGEIRLQWWRDLITSGNHAGSGPLAEALGSVIEHHNLPRETIHTYLEARIFDLYQDPMPDDATLEGYLGETVSVFFQMAALCLGAERSTNLANACGHAGMAVGLAGLLTKTGMLRGRGQTYVPIDLLEKHGLTREDWLASELFSEHYMVLDEWVRTADYHLTFARTVISELPTDIRSVFLPLALVSPKLALVKRKPKTTLTSALPLAPLSRQWHLFRGALRPIP